MFWVDYTIIGIIGLSTLASLMRGFVKEALSLAGWVAAYFIAKLFYPALSAQLVGRLEPEMLRQAAACVALFVGTLFVVGLINTVVGKLIAAGGLSGTDRMLGMVFGAARGVLMVAAMAYFLAYFTRLPEQDWWRESQLIAEFQQVGVWFFDNFGDALPSKVMPQAAEPATAVVPAHSSPRG